MSRTPRVLAAAIAATAIACASPLAATAATADQVTGTARTAAPAPHWRIVAAFQKQSSVDELAASGPASAWAVEECLAKPCTSANHVILRHWNGKTWQAEPQPANAKHAGNGGPLLAAAPGSPDVWAVYDEYDHQTRASVAEWTGKSWAHPTVFHAGVNFQALTAVSPSDFWVFGSAAEFGRGSYVLRYNGKSWAQAASPTGGVAPWAAEARSASDIWALAFSGTGFGFAASRWNGTHWVNQAVPPAPKGAGGATAVPSGDLAVSGPDNVWGYGYFAFKGAAATDWLLHWNGKAWSNVRVPYTLNESYADGPLGPDGHGGAWLAATPAGTSREYLYHVTAAGHWSRVPIPTLNGAKETFIAGFAAIPGTSSVYAYGGTGDGAGNDRGVILRYET